MTNPATLRVITVQLVVIAAAAAVTLGIHSGQAAAAVLFGGSIAVANQLLLLWRSTCKSRAPESDASAHLRELTRYTLERLLAVGILLALGMGPLGLAPLPLLMAFVAGQMILVVVTMFHGTRIHG